jgi:hypothetical protein
MFTSVAILLVIGCLFGLFAVSQVKPKVKASEGSSGLGKENFKSPIVPPNVARAASARSTKKPKRLRFDAQYLTKLARTFENDLIAGSWAKNGPGVGVAWTKRRTPEDLIDLMEVPLVKEQQKQRSKKHCGATVVRLDGSGEQVGMIQGDHVILQITNPLPEGYVLYVFVAESPTAESPTIEIELAGGDYPAPTVVIVSLGNSNPHVIAENVIVYFLGGETGRLSLVDGAAHIFSGSVSGLDSKVRLHNETVSVGGLRCDIYVDRESQIIAGKDEFTDCTAFLYKFASA